MSLRLKISFGFIIICILWGSSWAATKLALEAIPPFLGLGIRFSIASIILGVIIITQRLRVPHDTGFWKLIFILCTASFMIPFVLFYWAQMYVDSGLASVLFSTFPLWVAILSHYFLPYEKITFPRILGLGLGFLGIIVIFENGLSHVNMFILIGMGAIITGAMIQAYGLVALRRFGSNMHPVMLNFWPMIFCTIPLFVISGITEDYSSIVWDTKAIGSLMYLSLFCTVITFIVYFWLVKHVEVVVLSLSAFITPIIALLISVAIMDERLTTTTLFGSCIVLSGVAITVIGDFIKTKRRKV
jgi:drug/metabolite transporter (DMT)-like permease